MKNSFSKSLVGILVTGVFLIGDFSVTTALATDCRACGECQERNRKRKEDSDKCKKECLESHQKRVERCKKSVSEGLQLCLSNCKRQEDECNQDDDDDDDDDNGYRVRCDAQPCRDNCHRIAHEEMANCENRPVDCDASCPYSPEYCFCAGCASRAPH